MEIKLGNKKIGQGHPVFIIAELSGNHLQDYSRAEKLVRAAAVAGADAVKLQTYTPDTMTIDSDKEWFFVGGKDNPKDWQGQTLYELYKKAMTPWEWHPKLMKLATDLGLVFFSTPFDASAVDFLETLNVPCYKIASYEVTDIPLLKTVASTKKTVIVSVGFATLDEIEEAVKTLRENGTTDLALLHCLTSYGSDSDIVNAYLANIKDLQGRFNVVSGFSDNNAGIQLPVKAVKVGALIIEKHLTLSRADGGPDAQFSLEPAEFKEMVRRIRAGTSPTLLFAKEGERGSSNRVHYGPANEKEEYNKRFRRSIFAVKDIKKGEKLTAENIRVIRPAFGLQPKLYESILGKTATKDIKRETPLKWEMVRFDTLADSRPGRVKYINPKK